MFAPLLPFLVLFMTLLNGSEPLKNLCRFEPKMSPSVEENSGLQANGNYKSTDANEDAVAEENGSVGTYRPTGVQGSVAIATKPSESKPAPKRVDEQLNIEGKVFLVTGGGQGLGLAMAVYTTYLPPLDQLILNNTL